MARDENVKVASQRAADCALAVKEPVAAEELREVRSALEDLVVDGDGASPPRFAALGRRGQAKERHLDAQT